jgi:hypothetical protein
LTQREGDFDGFLSSAHRFHNMAIGAYLDSVQVLTVETIRSVDGQVFRFSRIGLTAAFRYRQEHTT